MNIMSFKSTREFRTWLKENFNASEGIWLRIYRKASSKPTVSYASALDEALCFGWIDGQKKPHDEESWLQKFSPRRAKSGWSKINTQHAKRLIKAKQMKPSGLAAINAAKKDGRWKSAYDSFSNAKVPDDFLKELGKNKKAKTFFATLNKTNLYSIVYRLQTAKKPETREKRMKAIIEMLSREEKFH